MDSLLTSYTLGASSLNFLYPKLKSLCSSHQESHSKNPKRSNPQNPNSKWRIYSSNTKPPASIFVPIVKKIKSFALKPSKYNWVSVLYTTPRDLCSEIIEGQCLQSGAFGIALLSVTTTAKVKISPLVVTLAGNPTFVSGLCAGVIAQLIKVLLYLWVERKWDLRLFFTSGGMPSSHSALCTALTTSVALCHGVADSLFPVCLGFSSIVMYDAIGVRRHAGMQAELDVETTSLTTVADPGIFVTGGGSAMVELLRPRIASFAILFLAAITTTSPGLLSQGRNQELNFGWARHRGGRRPPDQGW